MHYQGGTGDAISGDVPFSLGSLVVENLLSLMPLGRSAEPDWRDTESREARKDIFGLVQVISGCSMQGREAEPLEAIAPYL